MCVINSLCSKGFTERIVHVKPSKSGDARYNPFPPKGDGGVGGLVNKIVFEIITRCIASNYTYYPSSALSLIHQAITHNNWQISFCIMPKNKGTKWYHANDQSVDYVHRQS